MSSYTSGPWAIGAPRDKIICVNEAGSVRTTKNGWGKCVAKTPLASWMAPNEADANAHLIAASPCMYEALKKVETDLDAYLTDSILGDDAQAVDWSRVFRDETLKVVKAALLKASPLGGNDE